MQYKGRIENGLIVLNEPVSLPEGAQVTIAIKVSKTPAKQPEPIKTRMGALVGCVGDQADDWSENHDRYLGAEQET